MRRMHCVTASARSRALGHHDNAPKVLHNRGDGRKEAHERDDQVLVSGLLEGGPRSRSTIAVAPRAGQTCSGRSTAPRAICSSPPPAASPDLRDDRASGKGARSSLEVLPVPLKYWWSAPQGPSTNVAQAYARFAPIIERERICALRSTTRSRAIDAGRDRDGRGNRSASNARLIGRVRMKPNVICKRPCKMMVTIIPGQ